MIKTIFSKILLSLAFFMPFGYSLRPWLHRIRGVKMGKNIWIAKAVYLDELHPEDIEIGDNSVINYRTTVYTHSYFGPRQKKSTGKVIRCIYWSSLSNPPRGKNRGLFGY